MSIAIAIFALGSTAGLATAATAGACTQTSQDAQRACQASAQSDYQVGLGKCANIGVSGQRKRCQQDAAAEQTDALNLCDAQNDARNAACVKLGQAPYDPRIDPSNFVATIDNPWFPLRPGTTFVYEGQTSNGLEHDEFAVTRNTRVIAGVTCVEVSDRVWTDGVLTEDTLDWFAQDRDGNVWYFGENTHELEDGLISTIDGSFRAGVDGDKPGIVMKAHQVVGDFYRQEFSLANAEDFAEVAALNDSVTVPAGSYAHCLRTRETSPLEPDVLEDKLYAPGVGNILTVDVNTGERSALIRIITE
jgi:hypothetical protein